jgi:hypothetical protein
MCARIHNTALGGHMWKLGSRIHSCCIRAGIVHKIHSILCLVHSQTAFSSWHSIKQCSVVLLHTLVQSVVAVTLILCNLSLVGTMSRMTIYHIALMVSEAWLHVGWFIPLSRAWSRVARQSSCPSPRPRRVLFHKFSAGTLFALFLISVVPRMLSLMRISSSVPRTGVSLGPAEGSSYTYAGFNTVAMFPVLTRRDSSCLHSRVNRNVRCFAYTSISPHPSRDSGTPWVECTDYPVLTFTHRYPIHPVSSSLYSTLRFLYTLHRT